MQPQQESAGKPPIINCHTHIFTADHVPPFLAKTFIPGFLHRLLNLRFVVFCFRFYYSNILPLKFGSWSKRKQRLVYNIKIFIARNPVLKILALALGIFFTIQVFFILLEWLRPVMPPDSIADNYISIARKRLESLKLIWVPMSSLAQVVIVAAVLLFLKSGRNFILFIFKKILSIFNMLPGPHTKELLKRYINIGRFSFNRNQWENYKRLRNQYPNDTAFIVLPMDMEYMGAGTLKQGYRYRNQMEDLAKIKLNQKYTHRFFPFVFVDPRRMEYEPDFFSYRLNGKGSILLNECFIKEYIELHRFSGFKIYPALGYYPFDYRLLPLWKYAADNGIPILTHCIRGTIFYRGAKLKDWDYHPIFEQAAGSGKYEPLLLPQMKNIEFINNFTHPLNYLCLVEEKLLRKWVGKAGAVIKDMFGFKDQETKLGADLSQLKISFGHFGGDDEWKRYMELDRDNMSSQLVKFPEKGIDFLNDDNGKPSPGKLEQVWRNADWYTTICSMMLQYENVYSDLSYILHSHEIQPLLYQTLRNQKLRKRTLFGTDFYVVRNHKSEKHMLADMQCGLSVEDFDCISRENPQNFLENILPALNLRVEHVPSSNGIEFSKTSAIQKNQPYDTD